MNLKFWRWGFSSDRDTRMTSAELVRRINATYDGLTDLTDQEISEQFQFLREIAANLKANGQLAPDNQLIIDGFALIKLASWRAVKMAHHDVQLSAGISMVAGNIAELATGEGKTLVATLPAGLLALWGDGVHVMTVNAYLAKRDFELMQPVYQRLGLQAAYIETRMPDAEKREAYRADITYGVGNDFGFDYLRDQLKIKRRPQKSLGIDYQLQIRGLSERMEKPVQRGHAYAIIDEADSVMIDEASSALILSAASGQPHPHPEPYQLANQVGSSLKEELHYKIDPPSKVVGVTNLGLQTIMEKLDRTTKSKLARPWEQYVVSALRALHIVRRDVDYVVKDNTIQIVDAFTGRRFEDRSWSEGLHQAVETKEGVGVTEESQSMLRIARQHFFHLYDHRCGMTGTAIGCEEEFSHVFKMGVDCIPPNKQNQREMLPISFFDTTEEKENAIAKLTKKEWLRGVPVLIGTQSVEESEALSSKLNEFGIDNVVLNARNDADEAKIVSQAGLSGAVTVATNMAGRGTDIPLEKGITDQIGLCVILTAPNRSKRIDRQLIGRCARQGDPGRAMMFSCKQDQLFFDTSSLKWQSLKIGGSWDGGKIEKYISSLQRKNDEKDYQKRLKMSASQEWNAELISKLG
ncbi:MAG: hypothetical protein KTR18_01780 [Acidiferrobacterales bacterium]|nr:hypothetical protein [Acidiferrobacterales bacterium]